MNRRANQPPRRGVAKAEGIGFFSQAAYDLTIRRRIPSATAPAHSSHAVEGSGVGRMLLLSSAYVRPSTRMALLVAMYIGAEVAPVARSMTDKAVPLRLENST